MKRPSKHDDYVQKNAGARMLERIRANCPEFAEDDGDEDATIMELAAAMSGFNGDGYTIAQNLEHKGWNPNARLVETLDGGTFDEAIDELTAQWIIAENKQPQLPLGTKGQVKVWGKDLALLTPDKTAEGEITAISMKRGTYTVTVEAIGQQRGYGYIHKWEELEEQWRTTTPS